MTETSVWEKMEVVARARRDSDAILSALLDDNKKINVHLVDLWKHLQETFPDCSKRMTETLQDVISGDDRAAKHGMLFFGLHTRPSWCRKFLKEHNAPPIKFKLFYENGLKHNTEKLLSGELVCLQEYVEETRKEYIVT